jgi:hypothetical protein
MVTGRKHTPEEVADLLRQIDTAIASGMSSASACAECKITVQTYYRWRREYSMLTPNPGKRLKELELENERLKLLVADLSLEKQLLEQITRGST